MSTRSDSPSHLRPLPPLPAYLRHIARGVVWVIGIVALSLGVGTLGYHYLEGLSWIDAELNAAMILTGMGPADHLNTTGGKVFASAYALFSALAFLSSATLLLGPVAKRALHRMHLDMQAPRK